MTGFWPSMTRLNLCSPCTYRYANAACLRQHQKWCVIANIGVYARSYINAQWSALGPSPCRATRICMMTTAHNRRHGWQQQRLAPNPGLLLSLSCQAPVYLQAMMNNCREASHSSFTTPGQGIPWSLGRAPASRSTGELTMQTAIASSSQLSQPTCLHSRPDVPSRYPFSLAGDWTASVQAFAVACPNALP